MTDALERDELVKVLAHYDLGDLQTAQRIERGFVNDNWLVMTDRGCYFLKCRHPGLRRPEIIRAQHQLMQHLRQAGFPAPVLVHTAQDETLLILAGEFYEIQEHIEGQPYEHDRPGHLIEAALTLARYHTAVQGYLPQALCDLGDLYSPSLLGRALANLIQAWQIDEDSGLAPIVAQLKSHTAELAARFAGHARLPKLIIHGDYYAGNLLFDGDRIVGVVDYDKARLQPRAVELAEALIFFSSPRPGHLKHLVYPGVLDMEPFYDFLRNYACIAGLVEAELRTLPDYVRCIWLQVSLTSLLQKGSRPSDALGALQEVLVLAHWARANACRMIDAGCSTMSGRSFVGSGRRSP